MAPLIQVNTNDQIDSYVPDEERALYEVELAKLQPEWSFSIVPGFFKQSSPETDDLTYNPLADHFGLVDGLTWPAAVEKLQELNRTVADPSRERYKLLFSARHGQGYHNLAVEVFGLEEWDNHYSHLNGAVTPDGEKLVWGPDPFLTTRGEQQAKLMHESFHKEITQHGCPVPSRLFSSPFTRAAQTLCITMDGICVRNDAEDASKPLLAKERLHPIVKEDLRETIGEHTCDKRSDRGTFEKRMHGWGFVFEDGFVNDDIYYKSDWREPFHKQALRANGFLQDLFSDDFATDEIVYCASHSGEIKSLIAVTGHRRYTVPTAGMVPLLVKAVRNR